MLEMLVIDKKEREAKTEKRAEDRVKEKEGVGKGMSREAASSPPVPQPGFAY